MNKNILLLGVFVVVFVFGMYQMTVSHEKGHQQNCKYHGGTPSEINWGWNKASVTCDTEHYSTEIAQTDAVIDSVGYEMNTMFEFLFLGLGTILLFVAMK